MMRSRRRTPAARPAVRPRRRPQTARLRRPSVLAAVARPPVVAAAPLRRLRARSPATAELAKPAAWQQQVRRSQALPRGPRAWRHKNPGSPRTPFEADPLRPESAADQSAGARSPPADSPQAFARRRALRDTKESRLQSPPRAPPSDTWRSQSTSRPTGSHACTNPVAGEQPASQSVEKTAGSGDGRGSSTGFRKREGCLRLVYRFTDGFASIVEPETREHGRIG